MPEYLTPGVYFERQDAAQAVIRQARTDIAGFVGLAERGPLHLPVQVNSWRQFQAQYGNFLPYAYLAYAVKGFFDNGGSTCFVVRVAGPDAQRSGLTLLNAGGGQEMRIQARDEGVWGNSVSVTLAAIRPSDLEFSLVVTRGLLDRESFPKLSLRRDADRYFARIINEGDERTTPSNWIQVEDLLPEDGIPAASDLPDPAKSGWQTGSAYLQDGKDGVASLTVDDILGDFDPLNPHGKGLSAFDRVSAVGIVAIPDIHARPQVFLTAPPPLLPLTNPCCPPEIHSYAPPNPSGVLEQPPGFTRDEIRLMQRAMIEHCENHRDRVALLETPATGTGDRAPTLAETLDWRSQFDSQRGYAAFYYPWIKVLDPLPVALGPVRAIPPCGHVAGIYARIDNDTGPHRAPANTELFWAEDVTAIIDDDLQAALNPEGVNCIRAFSGRGLRVFGARTISSDPDWRYVNVRRLMIMIEAAVYDSTQWAVFEPHDFNLRQTLSMSLSSFLESVWRGGGLAGASPDQAFYVKCDDTNNPPESVAMGQLIVEVGVAPAIPAEFVVFRIGRTADEMEIVEV